MKDLNDNPYSDFKLSQALEALDWKLDESDFGIPRELVRVKDLPLSLAAFVRGTPKFELNDYKYQLNFGILYRFGEKIKPRSKNPIAYFLHKGKEKIPVYLQTIEKKIGDKIL